MSNSDTSNSIRLYNLMRVDKATLKKESVSGRFILTTEKTVFKKLYVSNIPINISNEEWEQLCNSKKTYRDAKQTPLLHKVRQQAVKYLKETNKIQ